jgi:uncharacterized membrane protein YhhN
MFRTTGKLLELLLLTRQASIHMLLEDMELIILRVMNCCTLPDLLVLGHMPHLQFRTNHIYIS